MTGRAGASAIVVGAGLAGLVTARVLSERFERVAVLERDPPDAASGVRRGIPQGRQSHVMLTAVGRHLLESWFPGLTDALTTRGAVPVDARDVVWHQNGSYRVRSALGLLALSMTGQLLERTVRESLLAQCPNVSLEEGTAVDAPLLADGRVTGVRIDGAERRADLVVGCTGRNTRFLDQLAEDGFPAPEMSAVHIDLAYGSRLVRRRPGLLDGSLAVVVEHPAAGHRVAIMAPVEGDRWLISAGSFHGDAIPCEPEEYEDFLRALPSPVIANVLSRTTGATPILTCRMATNQRRHVERLQRVPAGFVVLGDAIGSVNPLYAQGTAVTALQARALEEALSRHHPSSPALVGDFYRRASAALDGVWRTAAGGDFADPRTRGPRPPGIRLVNRYLDLVFLACHTSVRVADQTLRVQNLLAGPGSLMTPAMAARVLLAARRSPAAGHRPNGERIVAAGRAPRPEDGSPGSHRLGGR